MLIYELSQHELTLFPAPLHSLLLSFHIDHLPDSNGWVHRPQGGLLYWVPEDYRNGLTSSAVLTIPTHGPHRPVRLDAGGGDVADQAGRQRPFRQRAPRGRSVSLA